MNAEYEWNTMIHTLSYAGHAHNASDYLYNNEVCEQTVRFHSNIVQSPVVES